MHYCTTMRQGDDARLCVCMCSCWQRQKLWQNGRWGSNEHIISWCSLPLSVIASNLSSWLSFKDNEGSVAFLYAWWCQHVCRDQRERRSLCSHLEAFMRPFSFYGSNYNLSCSLECLCFHHMVYQEQFFFSFSFLTQDDECKQWISGKRDTVLFASSIELKNKQQLYK